MAREGGLFPFQRVRRDLLRFSGLNVRDDQPHQQSHPCDAAAPNAGAAAAAVPDVLDMDTTRPPGTNSQDLSSFFRRLPPEIRGMIYAEVWRQYLISEKCSEGGPAGNLPSVSHPRLHIHASMAHGRLQCTPCLVDPELPEAPPSSPSEGPSLKVRPAPDWYWWASSLSLRWGCHRRCQEEALWKYKEAIEADPDGDWTAWRRLDWAPFLPLFLTCKKMYAEAISSLFEEVTLVFTSSEDATRFFLRNPHPCAHKIRAVDFSFTHHKDHLYLFGIDDKHPRLSCCCCDVGFGPEAWRPLITYLRDSLPSLRYLRIRFGSKLRGAEATWLRLFWTWKPDQLLVELPPWEPHNGGEVDPICGEGAEVPFNVRRTRRISRPRVP